MSERPVGARPLDITLQSPAAERVRKVKALAGRSARRKQELFLIEGPQAVREVIAHRPQVVRDLYVGATAAERYGQIIDEALARGLSVHGATDEVVAAMSTDAQGLVAVAYIEHAEPDTVWAGRPTWVAILAHVRDPGNLGTAIRVADAAGADGVVLAGDCVEVTNPKVVRSSAGSLFHLPVVAMETVGEAIGAASAAGLQTFATVGSAEETLGEASVMAAVQRPTAWVFGNEAWGLSAEDVARCDRAVAIPVLGQAESLNLGTAVAVCLYSRLLAGGVGKGA